MLAHSPFTIQLLPLTLCVISKKLEFCSIEDRVTFLCCSKIELMCVWITNVREKRKSVTTVDDVQGLFSVLIIHRKCFVSFFCNDKNSAFIQGPDSYARVDDMNEPLDSS